ncbi:hypothetical protein J4470_00710 [Candidatus Woesearchaeota archaeon]|nr:hypothetical protein [Candidatus Woesearchaeota archaeon]
MASVSSIVRDIVSQNKLLQEAMWQGILSYAAVAEKVKERVEKELGSNVKESAIIMALRRYPETAFKKEAKKQFEAESEIIMKTGLAYFSFSKIPHLLEKLEKFYKRLEPDKDTLNVIQGNHETSVITNEKYGKAVKELLGKNKLKTEENDLVSISITLGKEFVHTPGVIFTITRKLYWEDVNIFELITTATELNLFFQQKYATKAYNAIYELVSGKH